MREKEKEFSMIIYPRGRRTGGTNTPPFSLSNIYTFFYRPYSHSLNSQHNQNIHSVDRSLTARQRRPLQRRGAGSSPPAMTLTSAASTESPQAGPSAPALYLLLRKGGHFHAQAP